MNWSKKSRLFLIVLLAIIIINPTIPKTMGEGYGEDSDSLGQFVDDYENDDNVSVAYQVINNVTLGCMELNKTETIVPSWETMYLVEYFENFPTGWTTGNGNLGTITKSNTQVYNGSWSVKIYSPNLNSYGYGFKGMVEATDNLLVVFHIWVQASVQPDDVQVLAAFDVSNGMVVNTFLDYHDSAYYIRNRHGVGDYEDVGIITAGDWFEVASFFNDTSNEVLYYIDRVYQGSFTPWNDNFNVDRIYVGDGSDVVGKGYYYLDDLLVGNGTMVLGFDFELDGYFITEDYLNYTKGQSLTLLTNASLPASTSITAEFSNDNNTWVDNEGNVGASALEAGFFALDLRDLNYTDCFIRYNFTGLGDSTSRLYQSRLITTEGPIGDEAPPVDDYSIIFLAIGLILMLSIAFLYTKSK